MRKLQWYDIQQLLLARILIITLPFLHRHLNVFLRVDVHHVEHSVLVHGMKRCNNLSHFIKVSFFLPVWSHAHSDVVNSEARRWHLNAETVLGKVNLVKTDFRKIKLKLTFSFTSSGMLKPNCCMYLWSQRRGKSALIHIIDEHILTPHSALIL